MAHASPPCCLRSAARAWQEPVQAIEARGAMLKELPSWNSKNVIACNLKETSIIERGYNLNPDWILEDFIALKNGELSSYTPHFYSKLAVSEER